MRRRWLLLLLLTAALPLLPAGAQQVPRSELTWGFCQVGGTGANTVWPLSRSEMLALRDELHVNTIRFFVHPAFIGLPQKTWTGPEAIDYTRFSEGDYKWRNPSPAVDSLDEVLELFRELSIHPVLLVFPVNEYIDYLSRPDLQFLSNPAKGLDYTGIVPAAQVRALTVTLARHVHQAFGDDFTLLYTEIAGGGDGAPGRGGDARGWREIVAAAKAEAPGAKVCSPELCVSMWWWAAALEARRRTPRGPGPLPYDFPYTDTWPRGDRLENYREAFDEVAVSYYGLGPDSVEWKDVAADRPALSAATEATLWVTRPHARPKRWLWAEAGWGAPLKDKPRFHLQRDLAALLFGMDHSAGALLWQAKDNEGSTGGVFSPKGEKTPAFALLAGVSEVVRANAAFFAADHERLNSDGFPVASGEWAEGDPAVLTRLVGRHLLLFSEAPTLATITLAKTGGGSLRELPVGHAYSSPWPLRIAPGADGAVTVSQIRPGLLYLLEVRPGG